MMVIFSLFSKGSELEPTKDEGIIFAVSMAAFKRKKKMIVEMKCELIDSMGDDLTVVNAARVSFNKMATEFRDKDEGLIRYLAQHDHWTPFSQVQYQVRCKMPIFIARQWYKSTIGITRNEVSRRYIKSDPEFYAPDFWRSAPTDGAKQGSSDTPVDIEQVWGDDPFITAVRASERAYKELLELGVAPEQARMVLPQCMMTEFIETGSLASAARVCKLRLDEHAQYDIRQFTQLFQEQVKHIAPISWKYLTK